MTDCSEMCTWRSLHWQVYIESLSNCVWDVLLLLLAKDVLHRPSDWLSTIAELLVRKEVSIHVSRGRQQKREDQYMIANVNEIESRLQRKLSFVVAVLAQTMKHKMRPPRVPSLHSRAKTLTPVILIWINLKWGWITGFLRGCTSLTGCIMCKKKLNLSSRTTSPCHSTVLS